MLTVSIPLSGGVLLTLQNDASGQPAPTWDHPTVRGDICMTTDQTGKQVGALRAYDPFGQPLDADGSVDTQNVPDNSPGALDYGWLGQHQRPFEHAGALDLVEMGARPYSPLLGRFLSVDPQPGGSANDYDYAGADPINTTDLDGQCWHWLCGGLRAVGRWAWRHKWDIALTAVSIAVPEVAGEVWAYRAYRLTRLAEEGIESARATRATSWLAGRRWVGRGGVRGFAKNGARMYSRGEGAAQRAWRGAAKKGKYGYSSNLTKSVKGRHDYVNFHINHGRWF